MIRGVSKVCESVINTEMNLKINKRNRKWNFRPQCYTESIVYLFFVFKKKKEKKKHKGIFTYEKLPLFWFNSWKLTTQGTVYAKEHFQFLIFTLLSSGISLEPGPLQTGIFFSTCFYVIWVHLPIYVLWKRAPSQLMAAFLYHSSSDSIKL